MLVRSSDRVALKSVLTYTALVFGLWIIYVSAFYSSVESNRIIPVRILLNELIRVCIFVAPVFVYIKYIAHEEILRYLKLKTNVSRGVLWGVIVSIAYVALVLARVVLFTEGGINLKPVPVEAWFTSLTISTLIEEVAFRGFLMQKLEQVIGFWAANVITACLFVAIHFPGWIIVGGSTLVPDKVIPMAEVLFLGLLLGFTFKRTQSLWSCVILHAVNNLMATILFS